MREWARSRCRTAEDKRLIDNEDLRLRELEHRFKNILTIVRSIVSQSLRSAESLNEARITIDERLAALGGAIEHLLSHQWQAAPLRHWRSRRSRISPFAIGESGLMAQRSRSVRRPR